MNEALPTPSPRRERAGVNAVVFAGGRVGLQLGIAVSAVVTARALGPDAFGTFAAATALAALVLLFGSFGMDGLFVQGVLPLDRYRTRSVQVGVLSVVAAVAVIAVFPGASRRSLVASCCIGAATALEIVRLPWTLQAQRGGHIGVQLGREALGRLLPPIAASAVALLTGSLEAMAVTLLAVSAASAIPVATRAAGLSRPDKSLVLDLRRGAGYALSSALFLVYFTSDQVVLSVLSSAHELGLYRAAYGFIGASLVVPVALNSDFLRTRLFVLDGQADEQRLLAGRVLRLCAALGLVATLVVFVGARILLRAAYGSEFVRSTDLLRVLAFAIAPHFVGSWASTVVITRGRLRSVVTWQALLVAVNLVGNLALVPSFGAKGSASMTVACEVVGLIGYLWLLRATARRPAPT